MTEVGVDVAGKAEVKEEATTRTNEVLRKRPSCMIPSHFR